MKTLGALLTILIGWSSAAHAQVPVAPNPDHESVLRDAYRPPAREEQEVRLRLLAGSLRGRPHGSGSHVHGGDLHPAQSPGAHGAPGLRGLLLQSAQAAAHRTPGQGPARGHPRRRRSRRSELRAVPARYLGEPSDLWTPGTRPTVPGPRALGAHRTVGRARRYEAPGTSRPPRLCIHRQDPARIPPPERRNRAVIIAGTNQSQPVAKNTSRLAGRASVSSRAKVGADGPRRARCVW